jgi:hypothetical protein
LVTILVSFGDQYAFAQDWCPAQGLYEEARTYQATAEINNKRIEAQENCLLATPTPSEPITDTVPITDTIPISDTTPISGTIPIDNTPFILPTETPNAP